MRINQSIFVLTGSLLMMSSAIAAKTQYVTSDNSLYTAICYQAADGNRTRLKTAIKNSGYSHHYVANNITCNGMPIATFAKQAGKLKNYQHLAPFMKKKTKA